jgi:hypothetical protein
MWTMKKIVLPMTLLILCVLAPAPTQAKPNRPLVGHVMALLAVFEEAGVLPPETSPQANALIHALIQTQAALTKGTNRATQAWFAEALRRASAHGAALDSHEGLTTRALEAILGYAATHPPAERPNVLAGLQAFNIGQGDLDLMAHIFVQARDRLRSSGQDIHRLYERRRQAMPFQ